MKRNKMQVFRSALYVLVTGLILSIQWWANLHGDREFAIRTVGFGLQIFGFAVVWQDITHAARKHKIPTLWATLKKKLRRRSVAVIVGQGAGSLSLTGSGTGIVVGPSNPTLEDRVAALAKEQEAIRKDVFLLRKETRDKAEELSSRIEERAQKLNKEVQEIKTAIQDAAEGLIHIEAVGIVLFGVGSAFSTGSVCNSVYLIGPMLFSDTFRRRSAR